MEGPQLKSAPPVARIFPKIASLPFAVHLVRVGLGEDVLDGLVNCRGETIMLVYASGTHVV